jgi:serine/threonine protein kinase
LAAFSLKIVYEPQKTGFEKEKDFIPAIGSVVGGAYLIEDTLGEAAFSRTYRAVDLRGGEEVCLKIIKSSNKDFFDQGLDECKILGVVNGERGCLQGKGEFYYKEHLIIVTELLKLDMYEVRTSLLLPERLFS